MNRRVVCVLLAVCVASSSGCGSILFPQMQEVPVECTNVPTASFAAPAVGTGCRSGQVLRLDRRKDVTVEIKAQGYHAQTVKIVSEVSVARAITSILLNGSHGIFTLFITTVVGVAADIKSGAWQVLEPTELIVELTSDGSTPAATQASWPTTTPSPSAYCQSCGARAGSTAFCTSCGARAR